MPEKSGTEKRQALQKIAGEAELRIVEALLDVAESWSQDEESSGPIANIQETAGTQASQAAAPLDVQYALAATFAQQLAESLKRFDNVGRRPASTVEKRDISMMVMLGDGAVTPNCEAAVHVPSTAPPRYSDEMLGTAAKLAADVAAMTVTFCTHGKHDALKELLDMRAGLDQHVSKVFGEAHETGSSVGTQTDENMKSTGKPVRVRITHALSGALVAELDASSGDSGMELRRQLSVQLQDSQLLGIKFLHCDQMLPLGAPLWMALPDDETIEMLDLQMAVLPSRTFQKTSSTEFSSLMKIVLVGDDGVGKTCLLGRFVDDVFSEQYISTIGVDFKNEVLQSCEGTVVKLQAWDTAGQERFRTITSSYYRGCNGALIVFDITDRRTFDSLDRWRREVCDAAGPTFYGFVLVGTKADMEAQRQVSQEEAQSWARSHGSQYVETSSKENSEVHAAFQTLLSRCLQ
eukprot:TRINITY_DN112220_c0_g1_i1.p1 TRINITY_DN112220_c0_g1~~TRINITY_DN112220_c0_g1_i1.p1  ORF type:complete len:463 (+),score=76.08 TRINITY_DN112220_c0_g1_i1:74-1462(+)